MNLAPGRLKRTPWCWLCGLGGCWDAAEVAVFEPVAVALERDDLGVVDQPVDHRCGDDVVTEHLAPNLDEPGMFGGRRKVGRGRRNEAAAPTALVQPQLRVQLIQPLVNSQSRSPRCPVHLMKCALPPLG